MILVIVAAAALAAPIAGFNASPGFGDANRANIAAMTVPPPPRGPAVEGADGVTAARAVQRIHQDKVKPLMNTGISPAIVWQR